MTFKQQVDPEQIELMKDMYSQGVADRKIAEFLGVSKGTVYNYTRAIRPRHLCPKVEFNGKTYSKSERGWWRSTTAPRTMLHRDVWAFHNGPVPADKDINHKDHDKDNNAIENLEPMDKVHHGRETNSWNYRKQRADKAAADLLETA